jgi:PIN domain nuclease of toxin-antitoxin system
MWNVDYEKKPEFRSSSESMTTAFTSLRKALNLLYSLEKDAALHLVKLPDYHKHLFDRMIVCQAIVHGMTILTPDEAIENIQSMEDSEGCPIHFFCHIRHKNTYEGPISG